MTLNHIVSGGRWDGGVVGERRRVVAQDGILVIVVALGAVEIGLIHHHGKLIASERADEGIRQLVCVGAICERVVDAAKSTDVVVCAALVPCFHKLRNNYGMNSSGKVCITTIACTRHHCVPVSGVKSSCYYYAIIFESQVVWMCRPSLCDLYGL